MSKLTVERNIMAQEVILRKQKARLKKLKKQRRKEKLEIFLKVTLKENGRIIKTRIQGLLLTAFGLFALITFKEDSTIQLVFLCGGLYLLFSKKAPNLNFEEYYEKDC